MPILMNTVEDGVYRVEFTARDEFDNRIELVAEILDGPRRRYQIGETLHTGYVREGHRSANQQKRRLYWNFFGLREDAHFDAEELMFRPFLAQVENRAIIAVAPDTFTHLPAGATRPTARVYGKGAGWVREDELPRFRAA